jgi:hypothetical protein
VTATMRPQTKPPTTAQARQEACPDCGALPGHKCVYLLPPESPWYTGKVEEMHVGAHAERFAAAAARVGP